MTDKAAKRRKELAAKLGVSPRTAANIITAKRDKSRAEKPKLQILARSFGRGPPDAYIVNIPYHPEKGHNFGGAVAEARRLAREHADILQIHIRREDRPGFPFACDWSRREKGDPWLFSWQNGAEDRAAQRLTLEGVRAWPNMTPRQFEERVSAAELEDEYTMLKDALDQEMKRPPAEIDTDKVREITFDLRIAQTSLVRRHSLSA
jgi:hypothetical protein